MQVDISSGASLIMSVMEKTAWILLLMRPIGQFNCQIDILVGQIERSRSCCFSDVGQFQIFAYKELAKIVAS